jgi:hypothetical protein
VSSKHGRNVSKDKATDRIKAFQSISTVYQEPGGFDTKMSGD